MSQLLSLRVLDTLFFVALRFMQHLSRSWAFAQRFSVFGGHSGTFGVPPDCHEIPAVVDLHSSALPPGVGKDRRSFSDAAFGQQRM